MKKRQLYRYAVDLFVKTLQEVTKRPKFEYKCNDADTSCWDVFVDEFGKNIGEEFVRNFLLFGFQSWFNNSCARDYSKSIRFSWVFGKAAIERWRANGIGTNMYIVRKSGIKKIVSYKTANSVERRHIVNTIRPSEERIKGEFYNTKRGFAWCLTNTTLYFHKSVRCCGCGFKDECKEALRLNYPLIYKVRGYEQ
jgi:hypothetical protein